MFPPVSRCSEGYALEYLWADKPESIANVEAAVIALMACLERPGRLWNMWNRGSTMAEFRALLLAAERGELKPVDEVKYLDHGSKAWIYEIRWQNITVQRVDQNGIKAFLTLQARALHAETPKLPMHLLGLHAHEKIIIEIPGDERASRDATNAAQDTEIDVAVKAYWEGEPTRWGMV